MKIEIAAIKVAKRIRKITPNIDELAADILKNGLINPITVMKTDADGYQLLAGLRRLRAAESLGWQEIDVAVLSPKDAEATLRIEYSENEQRENFTFSEKMDYARLIEEIEQAKAKERMLSGKNPSQADPPLVRAEGKKERETRTIVGRKIGMSGHQYDRAKFVAENAPDEVINELDRGERTIYGTYKELRSTGNEKPDDSTGAKNLLERAIRAERELDAIKYRQHNEIYHRDSIIENLKNRVTELESELAAARARIKELEAQNSESIK